jgi:hypothetical protein
MTFRPFLDSVNFSSITHAKLPGAAGGFRFQVRKKISESGE